MDRAVLLELRECCTSKLEAGRLARRLLGLSSLLLALEFRELALIVVDALL